MKGPKETALKAFLKAWQDDEEAVQRANATRHWATWAGSALGTRLLRAREFFPGYGLSASIWSQDFDKAAGMTASKSFRLPSELHGFPCLAGKRDSEPVEGRALSLQAELELKP